MISVVIPCFNEAEVLPVTIPLIITEIKKLGTEWELILIDDGSSDKTWNVILGLKSNYSEVIPIKFRSNKGHMLALLAGISAASGDWCITMDCDLQDPPEIIHELFSSAETNNSCLVYTQRNSRLRDTYFKRITAFLYYKIVSYASPSQVIPNSADFRLMHRCVLDELKNSSEHQIVFRLVLPAYGFKSSIVEFARPNRFAGETKYTLVKMTKLTLESLLTFGIKPLRFLSFVGLSTSLITALIGIAEVVVWYSGNSVEGIPTIILPMLFINSILLLGIGILGEYIGIVLNETRSRPRFSIENCPRQLTACLQ